MSYCRYKFVEKVGRINPSYLGTIITNWSMPIVCHPRGTMKWNSNIYESSLCKKHVGARWRRKIAQTKDSI